VRLRGEVLLLALGVASPLSAQRAQWELTVGGVAVHAERAVAFEGRRHTASGSGSGVELALGRSPISVWARAISSDLTASSDTATMAAATLGDIDARGRLSVGAVVLEGGLVRRVVTGQFASRVWQGLRVGGQLHFQSTDEAISFMCAAGYSPTLRSSGAGTTGTALDFESRLRFAPTRLPVWLAIGYRVERRELPGLTGSQLERLSGVLAAGGFALHRGRRPPT